MDMPDRRVQNPDNFLGDLWRETSWPVRLGIFTGIGLGFIAGFVIDVNLVMGPGFSIGLLILVMVGCLVGGGFVGLFLGVIADFIVGAIRGPQAKQVKQRRRP
jgi:hypothetical protein